jgi:hypothetical protein
MSIGLAIFLLGILGLAVYSQGFRRLLLVLLGLFMLLAGSTYYYYAYLPGIEICEQWNQEQDRRALEPPRPFNPDPAAGPYQNYHPDDRPSGCSRTTRKPDSPVNRPPTPRQSTGGVPG